MAENTNMKRDVPKKIIDGTTPFYLHPSDNPGTMISSCILRGDYYDLWEKAMRNALRAKNKFGFVDGTLSKPESTEPEACMWEPCNSMLVSWLFNSIDSVLQPSIAYMETERTVGRSARALLYWKCTTNSPTEG
jgi:gag-polypeptide of LTR copia-type